MEQNLDVGFGGKKSQGGPSDKQKVLKLKLKSQRCVFFLLIDIP